MPKRRIDPATGQPELTYHEQSFVDEFLHNGGNGARAAVAAGYTAARADQAAYQVLHRERVQHHIRQRIRESRVSADEIIGTLASHMRGDPAEFSGDAGTVRIQTPKKKGIGHPLKSIAGSICDSPSQPSNSAPSERSNVQTFQPSNAPRPRSFRAQLLSPL